MILEKAIEILIGGNAYATSTVILDPPSVSEAIGIVYTVVQPLFNSVWTIVLMGVGILFFGSLIAWIFGLFRRRD